MPRAGNLQLLFHHPQLLAQHHWTESAVAKTHTGDPKSGDAETAHQPMSSVHAWHHAVLHGEPVATSWRPWWWSIFLGFIDQLRQTKQKAYHGKKRKYQKWKYVILVNVDQKFNELYNYFKNLEVSSPSGHLIKLVDAHFSRLGLTVYNWFVMYIQCVRFTIFCL